MKANLNTAATMINVYLQADVPVTLLGAPGLGKSDVVKQVAKENNLKLIDFRLSTADPTDLSGLPFMDDGRSIFLPNKSFPLITDALPPHTDKYGKQVLIPVLDENGNHKVDAQGQPEYNKPHYDGWLLFLDEITNAPMSVQAAA